MRLLDAWNNCQHGGKMIRPNGVIIEKWLGDKPGLPSGFERFLKKNIDTIPMEDLMAEDWDVCTE